MTMTTAGTEEMDLANWQISGEEMTDGQALSATLTDTGTSSGDGSWMHLSVCQCRPTVTGFGICQFSRPRFGSA